MRDFRRCKDFKARFEEAKFHEIFKNDLKLEKLFLKNT